MRRRIYLFDNKIKPRIGNILRGIVVALLVIIQFVFIVCVSLMLTRYTLLFYLFLEIISLIILMALISRNQCTSFKVAWISIILLLPLTGQIMYILWGTSSSHKKINKAVMDKINNGFKYNVDDTKTRELFYKLYPNQRRISDFMTESEFPLYKNNDVTYFSMGEDLFESLLKDFEEAKKFIFLDFFIIAEGKLWTRIEKILTSKIQEGVEVWFLYDDFGAMFRTKDSFRSDLEKKGYKIAVFNPITKYVDKLHFNYRSHQKMVVIDGNIGYTGGINIADEYANIRQRFGTWKDTGIRIEGDAVWGITITFLQMWDISKEDGKSINYNLYKPTKEFKKNNCFCHFLSDGPANDPENPIVNVYQQMIAYAEHYLYITTPYLIIEEALQFELIRAAKSGIDVRIITPSIPDKKNVKLLTEYNYGVLLENGVKIYEYQPGFIHAKMIINEKSAVVGTVNMDYRSFYLHYECCAWLCDPNIVKEIKKDFLNTIKESKEVTYDDWNNKPWYIRGYQALLNLIQTII
ncbi:MAG: cardiolipin synthase [Lachnospiraceae bacterium]|nr:cardiolipin synthase [Lachnospiraceae bacterium]